MGGIKISPEARAAEVRAAAAKRLGEWRNFIILITF
jgi:hypothetical protein